MTTPFWYNQPSILLDKKYISQLWPINTMTNEEKLNSISKIVAILTVIGVIVTRKISFLVVGVVTLAIIVYSYFSVKQKLTQDIINKEPFSNKTGKTKTKANTKIKNNTSPEVQSLDTILQNDFHPTTKKNPFGNVLITDITDSPNRASAAPAFNPDVSDDINARVKQQTQMLNPTIINTSKQIYGDLKDNYDLDNSMMRFYATANTRVANDQGAYSQYLYGDMYSAKESNAEGAMMRVKDNSRYILI